MDTYNKTKEELIKEIESLKASLEQFQLLFNKAPLGYQSLDFDGNFIEVNQQWLTTLGYEREEVIGKWFGDFLTPPFRDGFRKRFPFFKAQGHIHSEFEMIHKNGSILFIAFDGKIGYDLNGEFKQTHCILQDITDRKRAEDELRKSEENLSITLNSIGDGVISTDINGFIVNMNPIAEKLCGLKLSESLGKTLSEVFKIINAETREVVADPVQKVLENGEIVGLANHTILVSKNGTEFQISDSAAPIKNKDGTITGVVLVFSDNTQKYESEIALRESEARYKALHNASFGGIAIHDKGIILECNQGLSDMMAYSYDELIGMDGLLLIAPNSRELVLNNILAGSEKPYEAIGLRKNGEQFPIQLEARNVPYNGKTVRTVEFRDITEQKKAKEALQKSEEKYRRIADNVSDVVWITDLEMTPTYISPSVERVYGIKPEDYLKLPLTQTYPPESFDKFRKTLAEEFAKEQDPKADKNRIFQLEVERYYSDGTLGWDFISATFIRDEQDNPIAIQGVSRDITERKKVEEKLIESDRIFNHALDMLCVAGFDGYFKTLNPSWSRILGYSTEELLSKPWLEYVHPEDKEGTQNIKANIVEGQEVYQFENRYICKDGSIKWLSWNSFPYLNEKIMFGIARDITIKKQEQELHRQTSLRLQMVSDNMLDLVSLTDLEGNYKFAGASHKILGYDVNSLIGKNVMDFVHPEDLPKLQAEFADFFANKTPNVETRYRYRCVDGNYLWFETFGTFILDEEGKHKEILFNTRNITERKQAEEALRESESKLSKIFKNNPTGLIIVHEKSKVIYDVNDFALEVLGYKKEDVVGKVCHNFLCPTEIGNCPICDLGQVLDRSERVLLRPDKTKIPILKTVVPITLNDEKYLLESFIDITERKKADLLIQKKSEEIEFHNQRLESLLRISQYQTQSTQELLDFALSEAIKLTKSKIGYIYFYNDKDKQFILNTWSKEVMKECKVMNPQTIYDLDKTGCWGEAVRQRKPIIINDYQADNSLKKGIPHGHIKLEKFLTIPVINNNKIVAVAGVANKENDYDNSDIMQLTLLMDSVWKTTERILLIEDLTIAKEKAEESDRLKSAFLANMSHEIRTPMNGILGFAGLLKNPNLTGNEQQKYISIIEKSGSRMLNIINDIVDISKIEAGLMKIETQESNVNEKLEYIYTFFKPEVEAKGMKLSYNTPLPAKSVTITTDIEKLYAILTNLVKNAVKYTNEGSIEFGYTKKHDYLEFYVKDTGIGIPKDRQEAIFERFIQADVADKMALQGAGLGLSITKAYVEMLGGKIWVESEEGIGSNFYFTLPFICNPTQEDPEQNLSKSFENELIKKLKILIAEDDEISELLIEITTKKFSKEILKARTGPETIEVCKNNPDLDLILMDIQMPEIGGYEATQQIRKFNKEVVIIAQTAYGLSGDRERAIEAGCNDYIAKPIDNNELTALIYKYFKNNKI